MTPFDKAKAICAKYYAEKCGYCPLRPVCCRPSYVSSYAKWLSDLDELAVSIYAKEFDSDEGALTTERSAEA